MGVLKTPNLTLYRPAAFGDFRQKS